MEIIIGIILIVTLIFIVCCLGVLRDIDNDK